MPTIKYKVDEYGAKKIILKDVSGQQKVGCECCDDAMIITFTSDGEGVGFGLESRLIDEKNREACGDGESGGPAQYLMSIVDDNQNNFYYLYNEALADNDWTSSFNIDLYANIDAGDNCYGPPPDFDIGEQDGDGFCLPKTPYSVTCVVEFRGKTKSGSFTTYRIPTGSNCAGFFVGTLTVYSSPLSDGSYFEFV